MIDRRDVLDRGYVELLNFMGTDMSIVNAARVSYLSDSKGDYADKKLINYLMMHRHTSPFEQVEFQWRVKCPLFVRSQWHRHRTWSYNEISRRYTSEDIEFYIPEMWRTEASGDKQKSSDTVIGRWETGHHDPISVTVYNHCDYAVRLYNRMLERGVSKEQARMVLPQNLYTIFYAKVDLHNLLHFIGLRSDSHAQWEIQQYSNAMLEMIRARVPWTVEAWEEYHGKKTS